MSRLADYRPERTPLEPGDHLTQPEFHRRYSAYEETKKAELIEGIVYIGGRVRLGHGSANATLAGVTGQYAARRTGVEGRLHPSVILDDQNEFQPDCILYRTGPDRTTSIVDGFIHGPPELVLEAVETFDAIEYYEKKDVYRRSGVAEYLVWQIYEDRIDWFALDDDGEYQLLPGDANGVIDSRIFPGLRLDVRAMLAGDLAKVLAALG